MRVLKVYQCLEYIENIFDGLVVRFEPYITRTSMILEAIYSMRELHITPTFTTLSTKYFNTNHILINNTHCLTVDILFHKFDVNLFHIKIKTYSRELKL